MTTKNAKEYNHGMFEVRVETEFAAAHFLKDYNGKCENLHGHNYKVFAHVRGDTLDEGGMLLDFAELKKALRDVCNKLDHTNLNGLDVFKQNPSAERIAKYIYDEVFNILQERKGTSMAKKIFAIDVFETSTSRARYTVD